MAANRRERPAAASAPAVSPWPAVLVACALGPGAGHALAGLPRRAIFIWLSFALLGVGYAAAIAAAPASVPWVGIVLVAVAAYVTSIGPLDHFARAAATAFWHRPCRVLACEHRPRRRHRPGHPDQPLGGLQGAVRFDDAFTPRGGPFLRQQARRRRARFCGSFIGLPRIDGRTSFIASSAWREITWRRAGRSSSSTAKSYPCAAWAAGARSTRIASSSCWSSSSGRRRISSRCRPTERAGWSPVAHGMCRLVAHSTPAPAP